MLHAPKNTFQDNPRRRKSRQMAHDDHTQKFEAVSTLDGSFEARNRAHVKGFHGARGHQLVFTLVGILVALGAIGALLALFYSLAMACNDYSMGFWCHTPQSHLWGQYSPFFSLRRTKQIKEDLLGPRLSWDLPQGCSVDVLSILSRHGARSPTATKELGYRDTLQRIQDHLLNHSSPKLREKYKFIGKYKYKFEADELNDFGRQQLEESARSAYFRYGRFENLGTPFIRASGQHRVVESAEKWRSKWMHYVNVIHEGPDWFASAPQSLLDEDDLPIHVISECESCNNTLHHSRCTAHETGKYSGKDDEAQEHYQDHFNDLTEKLNEDMRAKLHPFLNVTDTINLMQLCAFDTLHKKPTKKLSPFCNLFKNEDWENLDYYETLDKWYSYSHGNDLGPTQGVGWVNELIARLTDNPVNDTTSTNSTLVSSPDTFPLPKHGTRFFVDFTHDNDLVAAISALGFFKDSVVPMTERRDIIGTNGFSSAWVCPFAGRMWVEKISCEKEHSLDKQKRDSQKPLLNDSQEKNQGASGNTQAALGRPEGDAEEWVRVIINDRVMPMPCRGYQHARLGLCKLSDFLAGLEWACNGGNWTMCFGKDDDSTPSNEQ